MVVQLKLFRSYTFRHDPETIGISLQEHNAIFRGDNFPGHLPGGRTFTPARGG
ncbi:hypothetical protein ACFS3C_08575 [Azotobacter vinelandii]